jgi:hypothetical protein
MNFEEYMKKIESKFEKLTNENIGGFDASIAFESRFELEWFASKLKMYSFISYVEKIDEDTIKKYSKECFEYSRKNYKGLPRGIQNGVVSFSVLVSDDIDKSAVDFAKSRPKKHFSAFEMPIIIDLKNEQLIFYNQTPMWGGMYYKFFIEYIFENFNYL